MVWKYGSSGKRLVLQAQNLEFKPLSHKKKRKKGRTLQLLFVIPELPASLFLYFVANIK
jgi:hypothetical protein